MTRGLRNNNPGNLRLSKDKWQGLRAVQTDKAFFQFETMAHGYRALIRTLQNYRKLHKCQTITDFISRYAPKIENNTAGYIQRVCREMQVPTTYVPDVNDKATMCNFAAAISQVENGVSAVMADVYSGWELLNK
jgi:hypothetical protein